MQNQQQNQPRILLIEDEHTIIRMYQVAFELKSIDLLVADNIESAWKLTVKHRPAIVLLDLILPKDSISAFSLADSYGYDYLEKIKNNSETKDIPVLVFTNVDTLSDRARSAKLGAIDYVVKANTTPREVVEKVLDLIKT